ncbi:MAG: Asp-tRNA(Asn)/Glu-tRNA(Gln) amidotransferase subunit GatA [Saprospiraceae bacterium]|nr:Asp-tRNA(Asn)/Glu-tRNA(Gln) amidotransferase subunit GatA [Saprospiraceae bacterium]
MIYTSLKEIQNLLLSGELSTEQLVISYLERIETTKHLNAFIEVYDDEALNKARELDHKMKHSPDTLGKLFGCVISIKDMIVYKNHKVSAGSKILDGFISQFSGTALEAVIREDAIIIGRTNCDEFGMGSANTNSYFGPVANGADHKRVSGGSSGGAAVSVQTDSCLIAFGTDTGGSVRQPASLCGVIGFKPTYGLVSRHGLVAYASSFDQLGLMGRNVEDIDVVMTVISELDAYDATMFQTGLYDDQVIDDFNLTTIKVAYLEEAINNESLDKQIKDAFYGYLSHLTDQGVSVDKIQFPLLEYVVPVYYILTTAEASSNLSRYDGVRYGYRPEKVTTLEDLYVNTRTNGFGQEVKKRIMLGSFVLSEAYFDTYFTKAQQIRQMIKEQIHKIFEKFDFIILPTTPKVAWQVAEKPTNPMEIYLSDIYTVLSNLAGIPAVSVPLGNNIDGMPFGIQILSNVKDDKKLLHFIKHLKLA